MVYGVTDKRQADPQSRVNTFVHVNHTASNPRYGILLCINGTGIMNSWIRRNVTQETLDYAEMNRLAASVPAGSEGLSVVPFGNGAERMLCNRCPRAGIIGLDLNRHTTAHILRATQEGIAYSFRYGIDIMRGLGVRPDVIRAGAANLFLSPLFRQTLSMLTGARIELFNTDGALGAAAARRWAPATTRRAAKRSPRCAGWRSWNPPKLTERRWKKVTGHGSGK